MSCGVSCGHGSDPTLLWHRPVATALIQLPYAVGAALNRHKTKKNPKKQTKKRIFTYIIYTMCMCVYSEHHQNLIHYKLTIFQLKIKL